MVKYRSIRRTNGVFVYVSQMNHALREVYKQLARAAWVVEQIIMEERTSPTSFAAFLEQVLEEGIYNILCGLKVITNAETIDVGLSDMSWTRGATLPVPVNMASRFTRDYILLENITELFDDAVDLFRSMKRYM